MLYSAPIIRVVAAFFRRRQGLPLVVDPVMVSTSGARLLKPAASEFCARSCCFGHTGDAQSGRGGDSGRGEADLRDDLRAAAARCISSSFAALVKGGHLGAQEAWTFYDGRQELLLSAPFIRG